MRNSVGRWIALSAAVAALTACGSDGDSSQSSAAASVTPTSQPAVLIPTRAAMPTAASTRVVTSTSSTGSATSTLATASNTAPASAGTSATPPAPASVAAVVKSSIKLSSATYTVAEAAGSAVLTVERSGSSGATTIQYATQDGSGVSGTDYTATRGTMSWVDGDSSVKTIIVPFASHAAGKTFQVTLGSVSGNATIAAPSLATVTVAAPAEVIPPAAELAGYTTKTFGASMSMGENWHNMTFFGWSGAGGVNNSDGTVTVDGTGSGTISSAMVDKSKPNNWSGAAFGGGAYFEAQFSFANAGTQTLSRWPAFWACDIENMSANAVTAQTQWQGQPQGFGNWIETDFFEYDLQNLGEYGAQIHNWYGYHTKGQIQDVNAFKDAIKVPAGFQWSDVHKYGFLWVPATDTTQGYAQAYLDDVPVGPAVHWNKYDPKAPPAPVFGSTAFSVLDSRHLALIIDTGTENPMTIHSVTVWQASAANNLTQ